MEVNLGKVDTHFSRLFWYRLSVAPRSNSSRPHSQRHAVDLPSKPKALSPVLLEGTRGECRGIGTYAKRNGLFEWTDAVTVVTQSNISFEVEPIMFVTGPQVNVKHRNS